MPRLSEVLQEMNDTKAELAVWYAVGEYLEAYVPGPGTLPQKAFTDAEGRPVAEAVVVEVKKMIEESVIADLESKIVELESLEVGDVEEKKPKGKKGAEKGSGKKGSGKKAGKGRAAGSGPRLNLRQPGRSGGGVQQPEGAGS